MADMGTIAVVLIVIGTLALLYIAARTSRAPERNPLKYSRDALIADQNAGASRRSPVDLSHKLRSERRKKF
jgi:hypothetical protein